MKASSRSPGNDLNYIGCAYEGSGKNEKAREKLRERHGLDEPGTSCFITTCARDDFLSGLAHINLGEVGEGKKGKV